MATAALRALNHTAFVLTADLSNDRHEWRAEMGAGGTPQWPVGAGASSMEGWPCSGNRRKESGSHAPGAHNTANGRMGMGADVKRGTHTPSPRQQSQSRSVVPACMMCVVAWLRTSRMHSNPKALNPCGRAVSNSPTSSHSPVFAKRI